MTKNFSDRAARQTSNERVEMWYSGGNNFTDTSIEIGKRRRNPLTECGFQLGAREAFTKDHRLHKRIPRQTNSVIPNKCSVVNDQFKNC